MKTIQITLCAFFLLFASGCKKETPVYSVRGTVYESCNDHPVSDYDFVLRMANYSMIGWNNDICGTALTDANGNFKISYPDDRNHNSDSKILFGEAGLQIEGITNDNYELEIILSAEMKTKIFISTNQPYTANDTLFYALKNHQFNYQAIPGPFSNGFADSLTITGTMIKILKGELFGAVNPSEDDYIIWGRGFSDYQQARVSQDYHHIPWTTECNKTTDITINLQN